jgi:death-on-curing protein
MNYLTKDDLLDLHSYALERYGGLMGIKSQDRLQSALSAPYQQMFGAELYPDLPSKAAALMYMLVKSRPFMAANEATALLALLRLLAINGQSLRPDVGDSELAWVFRALNHSDMDKDSLELWLRESLAQV